MIPENHTLEGRIDNTRRDRFKSEAERRIAYFLEKNSIRYQYEPGVLVDSSSQKPRIWYPDFHLPEFGAYIEYYGLAGRENYDRGVSRKNRTYAKMGLAVIAVYPWTFAEDWRGHIMRELKNTTIRRYRSLMAKPYWAHDGSPPRSYRSTRQKGYTRGAAKPY